MVRLQENKNKIMMFLILLYVTLPVILFSFYWYNIIFGIITTIIIIFGFRKYFNGLLDSNPFNIKEDIEDKKNKIIFWVISILIIMIWTFFSGINGFTFQSDDFWVRDPIYNDLCNKPWPLWYDLSKNTEFVQSLIGNDKVLFVYYFTWWLTPAFISKTLHLNTGMAHFILYLYMVFGAISVLYLLCKIFKRLRYKYLFILIGFSGMDILEYIISTGHLPFLFKHMENNAHFFQMAGNTVQFYWVFNQSLPVWILVCLFILADKEICAGLGALTFAYSPFATFGMIPLVIYKIFKDGKIKDNIRKIFTVANTSIPAIMLFMYGLFYSLSGNTHHSFRTTLDFLVTLREPMSTTAMLIMYVLFYLLFIHMEFRFYYITILDGSRKEAKKWEYGKIVMAELMIFPLLYLHDFNFPLRSIVPAGFILMIIILRYFTEYEYKSDWKKKYKYILIVLLLIGSVTPFFEIVRNVQGTFSERNYTQKGFVSFDWMDKRFLAYEKGDDISLEEYIKRADLQFFIHDNLGLYRKITNNK